MRRPLLALIGLACLAGCVHQQRFRYIENQPECFGGAAGTDPLPGNGEKRDWPSLDCRHTLFTEGYIEFDEQGRAIDPAQKEKTLRLIDRARQSAPDGKVITVVYVHGWKNNSAEGPPDGKPQDPERFQTALLELGFRSQEAAHDRPDQTIPVVGVYMGWRGKSLTGPDWFTFLSYWSRRNTANHVGDGEDFGPALNAVIDKVNERPGSRVLLIGHSFGARVLEDAIETRKVELYRQTSGSDTLEPRVDLTLYVNSANDARLSMTRIEALRASPLHVRHPDYNPTFCQTNPLHTRCRDYPLLVAITSRGDLATKYLLPTANTINLDKSAPTPPKPDGRFIDPTPPSAIYRRSAAGHMKFLQSHLVSEVACPSITDRPVTTPDVPAGDDAVALLVKKEVARALGKTEELDALLKQENQVKLQAQIDQLQWEQALTRPACPAGDDSCRFRFRTRGEEPTCFQVDERRPIDAGDSNQKLQPFNTTAFWVMQVDPVVIKDHGDIWNTSFIEMLGQLMAPRGFFDPTAGRVKMSADTGAR